VVGVASVEALELPRVRARVDEITRECLTTPYDREYLRCVEASGRLRGCTLQFELRNSR
jgi:hypothetical protein